jgi:hypothetical protein
MLHTKPNDPIEGDIFPAPAGRLEGDTRRTAERKRVYLKADALAVELDAKAAVINLSETGMTGESDARIFVGEHAEVSFSGLHYVPATVRWVHGRRFGLKLLTRPPVIGAADEALTRDIRLLVGQTSRRAVVRNVSSTGLQIETDLPLHTGQPLLVKVLNGWSILTTVAWIDGIRAGVSMVEPVDLISF